jgi:hypothetical protein
VSTVSGVVASGGGLLQIVLTLASVLFVVAGAVAGARTLIARRRARRAGSRPPA